MLCGTAAPAEAKTSGDVVFVHGYGSCAGPQQSIGGPIQYMWLAGTPADKLHAVKFYDCESGKKGDQLLGYGPRYLNYAYLYGHNSTGFDQGIELLAYELAWYLYDNFTAQGKPVDLVGHSMGGLIIAWALLRVAMHDPWFPPSLNVPSALSFSAPFNGMADVGTCATVECQQFTSGSAFLAKLNMHGVGYGVTQWSVIGSSCADMLPAASATGVTGATNRLVYTDPCYNHTGYLWDYLNLLTASGVYNGVSFLLGMHSLAYMHKILR